jgi:serine/threonine protein kinase
LALAPGARLGPYEVAAQIGVGGMGEVYRATDTNLKRSVAMKVLPASLAGDAERLARFQREAEVLAALNHPHIAAIYGLEKSDGMFALVMELVEGPTLADRIATGAIPIDEALPIARQIAEALEAAHEQGIIHRDLKPANIKVRSDGTVKVLDFGLAKAMEPPAGSSPSVSMSPTITTPAMMTGVGMILGTAAYMSPEQAKGRAADRRSDVWAFGCVLYEMLTGKHAFEGEDVSDTLAAVLRGEPGWAALPAEVSPGIRILLKRCLERDHKKRIADISTARFVIDEPAIVAPAAGTAAAPVTLPPTPIWRRAIPFLVPAILAGALVGGVTWNLRPSSTPLTITRFPLTLAAGQEFTNTGRQLVAISPDGTQIAYVANRRLYLRSMSETEAGLIQGSDDPQGVTNPTFSPDGRSIAFASSTDRAVKRIAVSGGVAVTICPLTSPSLGLSWGYDGIVFSQRGSGVMRASTASGQPELLVSVKNDEEAYGPQVLPGGQAILFTFRTGTFPSLATGAGGVTPDLWDKAQIVVQSLKSGERKILIHGGSDGHYVPTGHIVYAVAGVLFAVPFDLRRLRVVGEPVPIVEGVRRGEATGTAHFSFSSNGSLIYVPGPASTRQRNLAFVDRKGQTEPLKLQGGPYEYPRVSPDGRRVAVGTNDGKDANVWIYDLTGASSLRQLTLSGRNQFPVWSADSERVAFQSDREGDLAIFWQRADGRGTAERLTRPNQGTAHVPSSWSPDGKRLLFGASKGSSTALWTLSLQDKNAAPFGDVQSANEIEAAFSPDGRWVVYTSAMTTGGQSSVFVQPFPSTGAKYLISDGRHPMWSPDGKELFSIGGAAGQVFVISVTTQPSFVFGDRTPVPGAGVLSSIEHPPGFPRNYDITPDGKRFISVAAAGQTESGGSATPQIQVVLNWFEDLKQRVPTK